MGDYTILSIDLGSTLGYAVGKGGVIVESGEVTLSPGPNKTHPGHRWMKFQQWLFNYKDVDEIVFENVMFFGNVKFEAAGTYYVEVLVDDVMKLRYPVPVVHVPMPNQPASNPAMTIFLALSVPACSAAIAVIGTLKTTDGFTPCSGNWSGATPVLLS